MDRSCWVDLERNEQQGITVVQALILTLLFVLAADVEEKVREEYQNDNQIDKREWYQPDDDSHLKNQVKANTAARK